MNDFVTLLSGIAFRSRGGVIYRSLFCCSAIFFSNKGISHESLKLLNALVKILYLSGGPVTKSLQRVDAPSQTHGRHPAVLDLKKLVIRRLMNTERSR